MNITDAIPHPLAIGLRDTRHSRELAAPICEFENAVFGPDFACAPASIRSWFDSGCLFSAAICGEAVAGRERVLSVITALLTSETSRDRLFRAEITDGDLTPWSQCAAGSRPAIYFASVISDNPGHLARMYESLGHDIGFFLAQEHLEPQTAFAVASGEAGFRHMSRNGFQPADARPYLGRYQVMTLDFASARTPFWQRLLRPAALRFRGHDELLALPAAPELTAADVRHADAHEVEKRLAAGKTERYRQMAAKKSY